MHTTNQKHKNVPDTYMVGKAQTCHMNPRGGRALRVSLIKYYFYNNFPVSYSLKKALKTKPFVRFYVKLLRPSKLQSLM